MSSAAERLTDAYGRIRRQIRRHDRDGLVRLLIPELLGSEIPTRSFRQYKQSPPWLLLLLIKWTLREGKSRPGRVLKSRDVRSLIDMMADLDSMGLRISDYDSLFLAMRRYLVQQIVFQHPQSYARFARQHLLFGNLDVSDSLASRFTRLTGMRIEDHTRLSTALLFAFARRDKQAISERWFSELPPHILSQLSTFLSSVARTPNEAAQWLRELDGESPNVYYEYYGDSPLRQYPLLADSGDYFPYSVTLLEEALANRVYDVLRSADASLFMRRFGRIFEDYVRRGLDYAALDYVNEADLPKVEGEKVVDFIIRDSNSRIFIDAKGVELSMAGLLSHRSEIVHDRMETSAIKAIRQGLESAQRFLGPDSDGQSENYLLVVTYKDFYISSGRDLARSIGEDRARELVSSVARPKIPLENMYFIPIDDFDSLVEMAKAGNSIAGVLRKAVETDKEPASRKMMFRMHIGVQPVPDYISDAFEELGIELERLVTQQAA